MAPRPVVRHQKNRHRGPPTLVDRPPFRGRYEGCGSYQKSPVLLGLTEVFPRSPHPQPPENRRLRLTHVSKHQPLLLVLCTHQPLLD